MASSALPSMAMRQFHAAAHEDREVPITLFDGLPGEAAGRQLPDEVVLFDGDRGPDGATFPWALRELSVRISGTADALRPGTALELYVGDLAVPAVRVDLALLLGGGGDRPLHIACAPGTRVRLVLVLPSGSAWPSGADRLTVLVRG
jgi:hypothetical protein